MMTEFLMKLAKPYSTQTSAKRHCGSCGQKVGGFWNVSVLDFSAVTYIQYNGNR